MSSHWYQESNPLCDEMIKTIDSDPFRGFVVYARSAEAKALNELNQDAFIVQADATQLVAVVTDGVGQSFRGDIAATAVTQSLLLSLWDAPYDATTTQYTDAIIQKLTQLAERVTTVLHDIDISYHASLLREALEQRRRLGSESMFVAVKADIRHNQLYVCWLGDCRVRLLLQSNAEVVWAEGDFDTCERWSSERLLVGAIHTAVFPLSDVKKIMLYSDGLQQIDGMPLHTASEQDQVVSAMQHSQLLPESDDVTCVMIEVVTH